MKFTIHKHVGGDWSIEKDGAIVDRCCWDEMLGEVGHLLLNGKGRFLENPQAVSRELYASVWAMHVTTVRDEYGPWLALFMFRVGNRFGGPLTPEEALAFVASQTLPEPRWPRWTFLKTYEEFVASQFWRRKPVIAGLITYQPEHVS